MTYLKLLSFVYECINKISTTYFHDYFTLLSSVHQYDTRQARMGNIFLNRIKTFYFVLSKRMMGQTLFHHLVLPFARIVDANFENYIYKPLIRLKQLRM